MSEKLSIREFSKWLFEEKGISVTDVAIGKAIKVGKIDKAIDRTNPKRPKIDPELALKEWGKNYDPSYQRKDSINDKMGEPTPVLVALKGGKEPTQEPQPVSGNSLAEIKRKTAEVRLHEAAIDLKKKRGELVDKGKVYSALFAAGQEVRTALQAIPDRFIDDILAARSRNEAHAVLFNAISDELEMLSEVANREINA